MLMGPKNGQALVALGFDVPNMSIIERYNNSARLMNGTEARKVLAFAKCEDDKRAWSWWSLTVYNWSHPHRSLPQLLDEPVGKQKYEHRFNSWR